MATADATRPGTGGRWKMSTDTWPTERWLGIVVIVALALLIAIRMGFRGVNVLGASARIG